MVSEVLARHPDIDFISNLDAYLPFNSMGHWNRCPPVTDSLTMSHPLIVALCAWILEPMEGARKWIGSFWCAGV